MSVDFSPYDADRPLLMRCTCGKEHTVAEHHKEQAALSATAELTRRSETAEFEAYSNAFVEASLIKAIFPQERERRNFLRAVGKGTAMAAIASVLPIASMQATSRCALTGPQDLIEIQIQPVHQHAKPLLLRK